MRRALTTWLLLLALGLPLAQPVAGSWRCPDGTLCVSGPDGQYRCADDSCRMPCCRESGGGCESRCEHGAWPGAPQVDAPADKQQSRIACVCTFTSTVRVTAGTLAPPHPEFFRTDTDALTLPAALAATGELQGAGYAPTSDPSPPAPPGLPPTGPRAPPSV
jgi:hypothetical protein